MIVDESLVLAKSVCIVTAIRLEMMVSTTSKGSDEARKPFGPFLWKGLLVAYRSSGEKKIDKQKLVNA